MDGMSADGSAEHLCWVSALMVRARMCVKDNKEVIEKQNVHDTLYQRVELPHDGIVMKSLLKIF